VLALLALAAAATAAPPPPLPAITVADGRVLARDIARVSPDGTAVVATLPTGSAQTELSEEQREALLRNRFPGGRFALRHSGTLRVVRAPAPRAAEPGTCYAARADIPASTAIERALLAEVACTREAADGWLVHDAATRTLFARDDIPAGTYLGHVRPGSVGTVAAGAKLVFRTREGPVTIEREVVALQPARGGRPVFARTRDGEVLHSALAEEDDE
jgi:hypothetical protein